MKTIEQEKERKRIWAREHSESNKTRARSWQLANPEKHKEIALRSYYKNKEKYKARRMAYHRNKLKTNIPYALKNSLRIRLSQMLREKTKNGSAVNLLGCSGEELMVYLESRFQEGMSWSNRTKWHIDHIIPLSRFDLENPLELAKACHFTNLQPLWAKDNLIKSNK